MIPKKLFSKYYAFTALIVLTFILFGYMTSRAITRVSSSPIEDHHSVFYARVIDQFDPHHRAATLSKMTEWNKGGLPFHFTLLNAEGEILYPPGQKLPFDWNSVAKPQQPYEYETVTDMNRSGRERLHTLIRFSGEPPEYLYASFDRGARARNSGIFFSAFGFLIVSVLLGIAVSMLLLFRSLRENVKLADSVIAELQTGNLKARFPIRKMDEIGQAMSRFNRMADEIERLVEQLKTAEQSRLALLQELAHDLRTPVASLRNLLETIQSKSEKLGPAGREEFVSLALKETAYFERLVEDLLVLAQVSEPRYQDKQEIITLNELLEDESENAAIHRESEHPSVSLAKNLPERLIRVQGDPHLLRRMIRNALNNAFSFAKHQVTVSLELEPEGYARIQIEDDGPGFTPEALATYGERRVTRVLESKQGDRLSVGLGSVIIKTVARLHRGSVKAGNRIQDGKAIGARIDLRIPASSA